MPRCGLSRLRNLDDRCSPPEACRPARASAGRRRFMSSSAPPSRCTAGPSWQVLAFVAQRRRSQNIAHSGLYSGKRNLFRVLGSVDHSVHGVSSMNGAHVCPLGPAALRPEAIVPLAPAVRAMPPAMSRAPAEVSSAPPCVASASRSRSLTACLLPSWAAGCEGRARPPHPTRHRNRRRPQRGLARGEESHERMDDPGMPPGSLLGYLESRRSSICVDSRRALLASLVAGRLPAILRTLRGLISLRKISDTFKQRLSLWSSSLLGSVIYHHDLCDRAGRLPDLRGPLFDRQRLLPAADRRDHDAAHALHRSQRCGPPRIRPQGGAAHGATAGGLTIDPQPAAGVATPRQPGSSAPASQSFGRTGAVWQADGAGPIALLSDRPRIKARRACVGWVSTARGVFPIAPRRRRASE